MRNLNDNEKAARCLEEVKWQITINTSNLNASIFSLFDDEPMYIGGDIGFGRPVKYLYPDGEIQYMNGYGCTCGLVDNVLMLSIEDKIRLLEYLL